MEAPGLQAWAVGTAVRLRGLVTRPELNGRVGVAERFDMKAARYAVKMQVATPEAQLLVKGENLEAVDVVEEVSNEMLVVNGLCYCAKHRLEACGTCARDWVVTNRMAQLGGDESSWDLAARLEAGERARNEPPHRAPRSAPQPATPQVPKRSQLRAGLDPSRLPAWPADEKVSTGFAMYSLGIIGEIVGCEQSAARPIPNVWRHVQDTLLWFADSLQGARERGIPLPRVTLSDEAQSENLMIDSIALHTLDNLSALVVVRYMYQTASGMSHERMQMFTQSLKLLPAGTLFCSCTVEVAQLRALKALLDHNAAQLDPAFLLRAQVGLPEMVRVSALRPVDLDMPRGEGERCAQCGALGASSACGSCKVTHYCNRKCQRAHWKQHKADCERRRLLEDIVEVDLDPLKQPQVLEMIFGGAAICKGGTVDVLDGAVVHVKLQVAIDEPDGQPMLCYDRDRKLCVGIWLRNCPHAERLVTKTRAAPHTRGRLEAIGLVGSKAYFPAVLNGATLRILLHEQLPPQPW